MDLKEAIIVLKTEKGVCELDISNLEANKHEIEFDEAVAIILDYIDRTEHTKTLAKGFKKMYEETKANSISIDKLKEIVDKYVSKNTSDRYFYTFEGCQKIVMELVNFIRDKEEQLI